MLSSEQRQRHDNDNDNNQVTVRIWPSQYASVSPNTWKSFGHVSLQTFKGGVDNQGYYISFWPGTPDKPCPCNDCADTHDHFHSLEEDTRYSGQATVDNTYHLHTLNVDMVNKHFEDRRAMNVRWTVSASVFTLRDPTVANCASLAHDCLVHGGLNNIVTRSDRVFLGVKDAMMSKMFLVSLSVVPFALTASYVLSNPACKVTIAINTVISTSLRVAGNFMWSLSQLFFPAEQTDPEMTVNMIKGLLTLIVEQGPTMTGAVLAGVLSLLTACVQGGASVVSNLTTFKPSDMERIMPSARDNDIKRALTMFKAAQDLANRNPAYESNRCSVM